MDKRIDADKLSGWLEKAAFVWFGRYGEYGEGYCKALSDIKTAMESGEFAPDPIPLPTIKPDRADSTRQLMHNTIEVMTDKQVRRLARTIGFEVSHD